MAEVEVALSVETDPTAAAFFDVDNTVMQGASIFHLARGLHRREFFSTRDILGAAWKQVYFRVVGVEDPEHVAEARTSALSFIAGHTVAELESLGEEIFDERMAHRIWPGTRALAQLHLDQGQRVWLVTAAPIEIAMIIARRLGLTGALGTVAEHVDGVYTGELVGDFLHGAAKGVAVRELADRFDLDLDRCSAYSDSYNDLPLLNAVGNPCAINPDARLRDHARAHGWRIRDYRTGRKAARAGVLRSRCRGRRGRNGGGRSGDQAQGRLRRPDPSGVRVPGRSRAGVAWVTIWFTTDVPPRSIDKIGGQPTAQSVGTHHGWTRSAAWSRRASSCPRRDPRAPGPDRPGARRGRPRPRPLRAVAADADQRAVPRRRDAGTPLGSP